MGLLFFCIAAIFTNVASSQAPDDADEGCTSRPEHPTYNNHILRLLDTSDYPKLLPYESDGTGGVWQTLDLDGDDTKWRASSQLYCTETTQVCGRMEGAQNNWMITQQISIPANVTSVVVEMDSMQEPLSTCSSSASSCIENLSLYVWENTAKIGSAADTENYRYVADISSGKGVRVEVTLAGESEMMYLGIRDNGTCVSVSRLLVYYRVCEGVSEGLVTVEETVVYDSDGNNTVEGQCVDNSVSITESPPLLECLESGQWKLVSDCQCSDQYFKHPSKHQCFKSPSAPEDLRVTNVTNVTLTLSWSPPPSYTDGSNDSGLLYYRVSYQDHHIIVIDRETELEVTGLTPFSQYTFSVSSENSISLQDSDVLIRTSSISIRTLQGVAGKVVDIMIKEGDEFITWSEPDPPYGRILHYNIMIIENKKTTIIGEYNGTRISVVTWSNWKIPSGIVTIQIQAETMIGPGEFSDPVSFMAPNTENDRSVSTDLFLMALIVAIFGVVVLGVCVATCAFVRKRKKRGSSNHPSQTSTLSQMTSVHMNSQPYTTDKEFLSAKEFPPPLPDAHKPQQISLGKNPCYEAVTPPGLKESCFLEENYSHAASIPTYMEITPK